ncbi:MAG: peptidylprolyl isomerase, partial [Georgfuchsia sp.]
MMTRTSLKIYTIALAALLAAAPALALSSAPGKVNGKQISKNQIDFFMASQKAKGIPDSPELRNAVREEVIRREVLVQEAQKQGLDKKPDIQAKMELARQGVLIQAYFDGYIKAHAISDEALKKEYETVKSQLGDKEYSVRHILVDSEDDAKAIIAKLKAGEKFDKLAAQSKDPGSKDKGGDLGWSVPTSYVKPFADALLKLNKGQYTETPVKSEFGWHVIQLDDTRSIKLPGYDEAKPQIQQRLQQQLVEKQVME